MKVNTSCEQCLYNHQLDRAKLLKDKEKEFLDRCIKIMEENDFSAPHLSYIFDGIYREYAPLKNPYTNEKKKFNDLVLSMETMIEDKIEASPDPLQTAIIYSRIGNYIDFSALDHVSVDEFLNLLEKGNTIPLDNDTYALFKKKLDYGKRFMLLCDNCGEIVLDKLLIKQIQKLYPHIVCFALVRGLDVVNDATREDALYCGLDTICTVYDNGKAIAGTVVELLTDELKAFLYTCDVILSKGQGNYEGMSHGNLNIFYSFLCKCDIFARRFKTDKMTGMFIYEGN
ncbi:MAG: DUF89 family protein [Holdemanella sp.]|nr:DUF89 family protein [Holdemanella sp.]